MGTKKDIEEAKILIVDDDIYLVRLLDVFLKTSGFSKVRSETDPRKVMALYKSFKPDLLILDLIMPYLDGFEILQQVRAINPKSHNVLILTSLNDPKTRLRAIKAGAKDFLVKPYNRNEAIARIKRLLTARQRLDHLEEFNKDIERYAKSLQPERPVQPLKKTRKDF